MKKFLVSSESRWQSLAPSFLPVLGCGSCWRFRARFFMEVSKSRYKKQTGGCLNGDWPGQTGGREVEIMSSGFGPIRMRCKAGPVFDAIAQSQYGETKQLAGAHTLYPTPSKTEDAEATSIPPTCSV
jgi:hypothetical protein